VRGTRYRPPRLGSGWPGPAPSPDHNTAGTARQIGPARTSQASRARDALKAEDTYDSRDAADAEAASAENHHPFTRAEHLDNAPSSGGYRRR
jgi:hypothetical protein